jgi:hypothetical protein
MFDVVRWAYLGERTWIWVRESDGAILARACDDDDDDDDIRGAYRAEWLGESNDPQDVIHEFWRLEDACLAAEKWWPPHGKDYRAWFESRKGGYFRKFGSTVVYVRRGDRDWYVSRQDGMVLAKDGTVEWFSSHEEAFKAVHKERHTPVDLDPFAPAYECWSWIKVVPSPLESYCAELRSRRRARDLAA